MWAQVLAFLYMLRLCLSKDPVYAEHRKGLEEAVRKGIIEPFNEGLNGPPRPPKPKQFQKEFWIVLIAAGPVTLLLLLLSKILAPFLWRVPW